MSRPGYEWDAIRRRWKPVDYSKLTAEELEQRHKDAEDLQAELEAQLKGLLPLSAAQAILNKGAEGLVALLIKLAKKSPEVLLSAIGA